MEALKRRVVGTAGHIDHGKTTLVRALTGVDCDRLPEEKRRGITIDLGFANWTAGDFQIGFVDVPGHERFVKNMLAGAGGIDSVLLVVAADESIMPQTREHFAICRLLGVRTGVVALTKADLVDRDIAELVRLEVEEMVAGSFLEGAPILPVSSTTGEGIDALRDALLRSVASVDDRDSSTRVFRLPIDRVFSLHGFGTVVTGTSFSGHIDTESEAEVLPGGNRTRIRTIQVHGEKRDTAFAGERTSLNLADLQVDDLHRGQQVLRPDTLRPSQVLTVRVDLLDDAKALKDGARIRFHHLSAELLGAVRLLGGEATKLDAGESAFAQVRLESPVVAIAGDRFVIRRYSPSVTIGGGTILDPHLGKLTRGTRPELLETLAGGSLQERVELMAKLAGLRGLSIGEVQARTGITVETLKKSLRGRDLPHLEELPGGGERRWIHHDLVADFRRRSMDFLQQYFKSNKMAVNVPKGEFLQKLVPSTVDAAVVTFLLQDLEREKIVILSGDALDIPGRSKTLGGAEGELARIIEARFKDAGLQPPPVSELIQTIAQRPKVIEGIISFLVKQGTLVRLAEGVYLHQGVLESAKEKMRTRKGETIDVAGFKEFFGLSRKIAIPLLECFDRDGVTRRVGDARQVL